MDSNELSLRLLSSEMLDDTTHANRSGFWLRMARERAGKSQEGAALELHLKPSSKSTVSDWENGLREPKPKQLRALARYYEVPLSVFVHPEPTAMERLDELVHAAEELEREDWEREAEDDPPSSADSGGGRRIP